MKTRNKFILIILVALLLNIIWEFSHFQLYNDLSGISKNFHLIQASFIDALIILIIFTLISIKNKTINWINKPSKLDYIIIIILGLIVAISIETWALSIGRWTYKNIMPTIFNIGISPLIQIFTTALISLYIIKKTKLV